VCDTKEWIVGRTGHLPKAQSNKDDAMKKEAREILAAKRPLLLPETPQKSPAAAAAAELPTDVEPAVAATGVHVELAVAPVPMEGVGPTSVPEGGAEASAPDASLEEQLAALQARCALLEQRIKSGKENAQSGVRRGLDLPGGKHLRQSSKPERRSKRQRRPTFKSLNTNSSS